MCECVIQAAKRYFLLSKLMEFFEIEKPSIPLDPKETFVRMFSYYFPYFFLFPICLVLMYASSSLYSIKSLILKILWIHKKYSHCIYAQHKNFKMKKKSFLH